MNCSNNLYELLRLMFSKNSIIVPSMLKSALMLEATPYWHKLEILVTSLKCIKTKVTSLLLKCKKQRVQIFLLKCSKIHSCQKNKQPKYRNLKMLLQHSTCRLELQNSICTSLLLISPYLLYCCKQQDSQSDLRAHGDLTWVILISQK